MTRARTPSASVQSALDPSASIDGVIHTIRGERVILDADLAKLYGVPTKALNQAVRRNPDKFPADFMFELTRKEAMDLQKAKHQEDVILRSQIVTLKHGRHMKHLPYAFTEHGAIMAANILNSPQAVQMSVFVVRAFVKMRSLLTDTHELATKLAALEKELTSRLDTHETAISEFMRRIMLLLDPPPSPEVPAKEMGFHTTLKSSKQLGKSTSD
jgi:ORF6N domain